MQRLTRKRSTSLSSTAESAHHTSIEPKPERPGLIRKLSQTFSKSSDNGSTEKSHRPRKLSLTNIMSLVKASTSQTSLHTAYKDAEPSNITLHSPPPPRTKKPAPPLKPEKPSAKSKPSHRMDLKPGRHTAGRVYSKPISLPHSHPDSFFATRRTSPRGIEKAVVKENMNVNRVDLMRSEVRSVGSESSGESEAVSRSSFGSGYGPGEEVPSENGEVRADAEGADAKTDADTQPELQRPQREGSPDSTLNGDADSCTTSVCHSRVASSEYGLSEVDVSFMKSTFEHMRIMGLPVCSVPDFQHICVPFVLSESEVTASPSTTPTSESHTHSSPSSPSSSVDYQAALRTPLPPSPASSSGRSTRTAPLLTPLSINTTHERAPPRQSIPLTPPPLDTISLTSSPSSPIHSQSIVIRPTTLTNTFDIYSDFSDSFSDSSLDSPTSPTSSHSDTSSCYSQSSYHPTLIDKALDAADKMLFPSPRDDYHEFVVPPHAPPVPILPVHPRLNSHVLPAEVDALRPVRSVGSGTPPTLVQAVGMAARPPIGARSQSHGHGHREVPVPVPGSTLGSLRPSRPERTSTAPLLHHFSRSSMSSSDTQVDGGDATSHTTLTMLFEHPDTIPATAAVLAQPSITSDMNKPLPIELLRRSSAKEPRQVHPPPRPYSPEFYSTPTIVHTPRSPLSPLNPSVPTRPTRPRLQNHSSSSTLSANTSTSTSTSTSSARWYGPLSAKSSSTSLSSRATTVSSSRTARSVREDEGEENDGGMIQATGGFRSWKKASGKVSGSWYTPAKPPSPSPTVSMRSTCSLDVVDPERTYLPPPNGPVTPSRRHISSTTTTTTSSSRTGRPAVGSRSQSERTVSVVSSSSTLVDKMYGGSLSQQQHARPRPRPSPLGPSSHANMNTTPARPSFIHTPASDSLLFAAPVTKSDPPIPRGASIMRKASPIPPLNTFRAEKSVRIMDGRSSRRSARVVEAGILDSA